MFSSHCSRVLPRLRFLVWSLGRFGSMMVVESGRVDTSARAEASPRITEQVQKIRMSRPTDGVSVEGMDLPLYTIRGTPDDTRLVLVVWCQGDRRWFSGEMQESDKKQGKRTQKCKYLKNVMAQHQIWLRRSIPINGGLIQAIPTLPPPQPIKEATKASNLQRIPPGVQGRSHFTYFSKLVSRGANGFVNVSLFNSATSSFHSTFVELIGEFVASMFGEVLVEGASLSMEVEEDASAVSDESRVVAEMGGGLADVDASWFSTSIELMCPKVKP
ncbi:hypothetical protein Tco_0913119 [Tanacetum coccineum]